ncbi:DNA sulfur modification protein DndB [Paenibacillus sp. UNC499MF]|uniref:DNA sulfur modification protein DndB n=1 Tax=Paenibacillus sp. UNC499MF TaxID=1502751 RepID=UPI0008A07CD0|nr:DNA sulfur modification protein DndB [Paenibacillus sp. UNC499MF]SEF89909.1 DNA-sulfur modification-associated [Paenibacillus sp. UNC499MF]
MDGLCLRMTIHPFCERFGLATVALKVQDLLNYTMIDAIVQRKLSKMQRRKISNYLQERELDQVFFGPVTLSLRDVSQLTRTSEELYLRHGSKLSIIDGQHRILALGFVNEQMQKEVKRTERKLASLRVRHRKETENGELADEIAQVSGLLEQMEARRLGLMESELAVQIYIGLNEVEEQQLFGDINSKVQLVSKELGHSFDSVDPLNLVIQQVVDHNMLLKEAGVEKRSNLTAFNRNFTCLSWMYSTAVMLFSGKMQSSYELQRKIRKETATYVEILHQFYNTILPMMPEQPGLVQVTSANRVMQESIALYANQFLFQNGVYNPEWTSCLRILEGFDWSHDNEELVYIFGSLDNGKLNLIHEKSLRKHGKLVSFFLEGIEPDGLKSAELA